MEMRIGVRENAGLQIIDLSCERLPWVKGDAEFVRRLDRSLTELFSDRSPIDAMDVSRHSEEGVRRILRDDGVSCDPQLSITFVEQAECALDVLSIPTDARDLRVLRRLDYINELSKTIAVKDVQVCSKVPLVFHPSSSERRLSLPLNVKKSLWLDCVCVAVGGKTLAVCPIQQVVDVGHFNLPVPAIGVGDYAELRAGGAATVELTVGQNPGKVLSLKNIPVDVWAPTAPAVALFVDIGSTRAKMIEVTAQEGSAEAGAVVDLSAISSLGAADLEHAVKGVMAHGPSDTPTFCNRFGMALLSKADLKDLSCGELGCAIADSVSRLASHYSKRGSLVSGVYWSFPKLEPQEGWNLKAVSDIATREAAASMPGKVTLLWEHDMLCFRFDAALRTLAKRGKAELAKQKRIHSENKRKSKAKQAEVDAYRAEKARWDDRWMITKWFVSAPERPDVSGYRPEDVPRVEDFYCMFVEIGAESGLRNFVILDAGGLSLDIYGKIGKQTYGKSFRAGGALLTDELLAWGLGNGHLKGDSATKLVAETMKIEACRSRSELNRPFAKFCKNETKRIYGAAVADMSDWLTEAQGKSNEGIPVILSGGAMSNDFLKEILEASLSKIPHQVITAEHLAALVQGNSDAQVDNLPRFCLAARGYGKPKTKSDVAFDVVGGTIEFALKGHRSAG